MANYTIKTNNKILKDNIYELQDAVNYSINYLEKNLQNAKFNTQVSDELASLNIYNLDVNDKDKQQIFNQELENFKALNNLFKAPNLKININNNNRDE